MNSQSRIEEFIQSIAGVKDMSDVVLVGGTAKETAGTMTTTNNGNCTNATYDGCNKATNRGDCKNASGVCNSSKNGGSCNNAYVPPSFSNMIEANCNQ